MFRVSGSRFRNSYVGSSEFGFRVSGSGFRTSEAREFRVRISCFVFRGPGFVRRKLGVEELAVLASPLGLTKQAPVQDARRDPHGLVSGPSLNAMKRSTVSKTIQIKLHSGLRFFFFFSLLLSSLELGDTEVYEP